jgi:hypothetical protein
VEKKEYMPGAYIVAVYQENWYVGQVMEKEGEPEAEEADCYVFVSFMKRTTGDLLQWPKQLDVLNVLKDDILFSCQPPTPSRATSSSRSTTFSLSKIDLKNAKRLFLLNKAYYPTKISPFKTTITLGAGRLCAHTGTVSCWFVTVGVWVCVGGCVCVCLCACVCVSVCVSVPVQCQHVTYGTVSDLTLVG